MKFRSFARTSPILLLVASTAAARGSAFAQTQSQIVQLLAHDQTDATGRVLDRPARLDIEAQPLAEALTRLSKSSGATIAFSPSVMEQEDRVVSCRCAGATIGQALHEILQGTAFQYSAFKGQVIVFRLAEDPDLEPVLSPLRFGRLATFRPAALRAVLGEPVALFAGAVRGARADGPQKPVVAAQEGQVTGAVQEGTISGRVVEANTLRPLTGAQVSIPGMGIGGLANNAGRYRLASVPAGEVAIRVQMLGYGTEERTLTVGAGQSVVLDFELSEQALALDQIVVTGTPGGTQARAIGNAVSNVQMQEVAERRTPPNMQTLISAEVPGLRLRSAGGEIGSGGTLQIRGTGSLVLSNEPLIFVDGVRVDNRTNPESAAFVNSRGGPHRLNDLNLNEIERIEVIKGPAAATLYGTEASNGVIHIFTKKGTQGAPQFEVVLRQGANFLWNAEDKYPLVWGRDPDSGELLSTNLVALEESRGTPIFTTGYPQSVFASVAGGIANLRYYFSTDIGRDEGIVDYQWQNKLSTRTNLSYTTESFEAGVNLGFVRQKTHTSGSEQAVTFQVMWGSPLKLDGPSRGLFRNAHEDYVNWVDGEEEVDKVTGGFYVRHSPLPWLTHRLSVGGDFGNIRSFSLWPRSPRQPGAFSRSIGQKDVIQDRTALTTIEYTASAPIQLSDGLSLETSSGVQYYQRKTQITQASGVEFPVPGVSTVTAAAQHFGDEDFIENKTFGVFVQEQVGWKNRIFLTAAIRGDDNSAFGENFNFVTYPKLSASWVVSEEPFWGVSWIPTLKVRTAWGQAGQQPDVFAATQLYQPATGPGGRPSLTPSNIGNPDLKPEVGEEIEVGFDASLLDERIALAFTYYDQKRKDAIVPQAALPSLGFPGVQFVNIGEISNRGFEIAASAQILRSRAWDWDVGLTLSTTRNRIDDLGGIIPPLVGQPWPGQRHVEGYPVAALFMKKVVSAEWDENGNLVNTLCEGGDPITGGGPPVPCEEAGTAYWGQPVPSWDVGLTTTLRYGPITLSATADGQGGYVKCNGDIGWAHVFFRNTRQINLAPPEQDPILAAYDAMGAVCQPGLVDAGFSKLRDISLRYALPESLATRIGATRASVTLSAQNMFTLWQASQGSFGAPIIDPEVHSNDDENGIGDKNAYVQDLWPTTQRINLILRATF